MRDPIRRAVPRGRALMNGEYRNFLVKEHDSPRCRSRRIVPCSQS
ncbi:hypothetical protein NKI94_29370 [Mesorhizobium australicum]